MLRSIIIALTLSLALVMPAHALTPGQAAKLSGFLDRSNAELNEANFNLLETIPGGQSQDHELSSVIYDSVFNAERYFESFALVVYIYSLMLDSRDQATVEKIMVMQAQKTVYEADSTVNVVNRGLAKLQSSAAIAEARKLRDKVRKIRDEIQRAFPDKW